MSTDAFRSDYAAILKQAREKASQVVRASALAMGGGMVEKSPVLTGRFKSNWQIGIGRVNLDVSSSAGAGSLGRIQQGLAGIKTGETIYITNSLPYAKRLEYEGWSRQAPSGMVRLTVMEFQASVGAAVKEMK